VQRRLMLCITTLQAQEKEIKEQNPELLEVTTERFATVEVITNHGTRTYHLDNTGDVEVSRALQTIFDEISALPDVSATFEFAPGVYYLEAPVTLKIASVKMQGNGHGGLDIHGANIESGTIFRLGKNCGPNCADATTACLAVFERVSPCRSIGMALARTSEIVAAVANGRTCLSKRLLVGQSIRFRSVASNSPRPPRPTFTPRAPPETGWVDICCVSPL